MIRILFITSIISVTFFSCKKKTSIPDPAEQTIDKKVVYKVFAAKDYSSTIYNTVNTTLTLTIGKNSLSNGLFSKTWDTTIVQPLQSVPNFTNAIQIEKVIPINETKETLQVSYAIKYDNNGSISQNGRFESIPKTTTIFLMSIDL